MSEFFRAIWKDIRQRKNLELYLVLAVMIVIVVADIFGVESTAEFFEIVLAALAVLVYGMIEDRRTSERIEEKIDAVAAAELRTEIFSEWDFVTFEQTLQTADEVWNLAEANYEFLHYHSESFRAFIRRGGRLRILLVDPESHSARLVAESAAGKRELEYLNLRLHLSIEQIKDFLGETADKESIQVKVVDHLPAAVVTVVNPLAVDSKIFVTLNGFKQPGKGRPSFVLTKVDGRWFDFYLDSFVSLWEAEGSRVLRF